jgi:hypothetical protein
VQLDDAVAARVLTEEREDGVHETRHAGEQQTRAETQRDAQVLQVGLTDGRRVLAEQSVDAHS